MNPSLKRLLRVCANALEAVADLDATAEQCARRKDAAALLRCIAAELSDGVRLTGPLDREEWDGR